MHETNESFVLTVPEFHVKKGEIVAVCGRVGSGKSSLIHAILGDMEKVSIPSLSLINLLLNSTRSSSGIKSTCSLVAAK